MNWGGAIVLSQQRTHRSTWPIYLALLLGCLCLVIAGGVFVALTLSVPRTQLTRDFAQMETVAVCMAVFATGWLFLACTRRLPLNRFLDSISWSEDWRRVPLYLALGLSIGALVQKLTHSLPASYVFSWRFVLVSVVGTVALQPLLEEVYFRGILFESLTSRFNDLVAIAIVGVVHILMHISPHRWTLVPIAVALAVTRILSRSTGACFLLHASYNLGVLIF